MPENKNSRIRISCLLRLLKANAFPNTRRVSEALRQYGAANYDICSRTIQRDVAYLQSHYGAPIEYSAKERGYYLVDPSWSGYSPLLDAEEMKAAMVGSHIAGEIVPPSELRQRIRRSADAISGSHPAAKELLSELSSLVAHGSIGSFEPSVFQNVFECWRSHNCFVCKYRNVDGEDLEQFVEPHVLTFYNNIWYVRGKCIDVSRKGSKVYSLRTYALHRMRDVRRRNRVFVPDDRLIKAVKQRGPFDLECLPKVTLKLGGRSSVYGREFFPDGECRENPDGTLLLTLCNAMAYRVLNFIMCSDGEATVVEPASLQERVLASLERVKNAMENPERLQLRTQQC